MTILQALLLGILQGITEFLPISSSGHLVLAETWFDLEVEELLSFDVVLHAGTLVALIVYFWPTLINMLKGLWIDIKRMLKIESKQELRDPEHPREQVWYLIVATLPVVALGPFLKDIVEGSFRSATMVVMMLGVTAVFLALAELIGKRKEPRVDSLKTALMMGCFQVMALIPGVSRSGSTIVGGLFGGLKREAAARFAFLMAIPAIGGALVFLINDLVEVGVKGVGVVPLVVGFVSSVLVSFGAMYGMLRFLRTRSLWWFVGYLVVVNVLWFVLA